MIQGSIDTTYQTQQRDLFLSGLASEIGASAFFIWHALKSHADWHTGESWPGVRALMQDTRLASKTVQSAIKVLLEHQLLRTKGYRGKRQIYVARELMDVRFGKHVICTIVMDYVPQSMRERLAKLKASASGESFDDEDVWADVEVIPGPGPVWDAERKMLRHKLRADEIPAADGEHAPVPHRISQ